MPLNEIAGQVVIEAMTVAVGVSVGTSQLGGGGGEDTGEGDTGGNAAARSNRSNRAGKTGGSRSGEPELHFGGQMLLAFCGATLFAANVAPTEEIVMIAVETSWVRLLGLAFVSLIVGALILHYSEFRGAREFVRTEGFVSVLVGSVSTYAVALVASGLILWFFGRFDGVSLYTSLAQVIVLGVAATLGASAGRLLLQ
jgi:putative integral membrane protein (TIGR02587 family)